MGELGISFQFGLDLVPACSQAWVHLVLFMVISEGATKDSQEAQNDFHF
jgi:hypothetical protein